MRLFELTEWFDKYSGPECIWFAKRLSGDETLANGSPNPGPRIPREVLAYALSFSKEKENGKPENRFPLTVDSHAAECGQPQSVFFEDERHGGPKGGFRIAGFGDSSALLDPENTGALTLFAFVLDKARAVADVSVWVCRNVADEELVEYRIGPVEPGTYVFQSEHSGLRTVMPPVDLPV